MSINIFGNAGNAAFALPLEQATPDIPSTQNYVLAWNSSTGALAYVPCSINKVTGDVTLSGHLDLAATKVLKVTGTQVVGPRRTGWTVPTGTATRATFDTATVTLPQLAERVMALHQDLVAHGLIGA